MNDYGKFARILLNSDKRFSFLTSSSEKDRSFAFVNQVPKFSTLSDSTIIDLIANPIANVIIKDYPNLERIRISKCPNLMKITLSNCPKLRVLDCIGNPSVKTLQIKGCDGIEAFDVSFCDYLTTIDSKEFLNLKYLSISHTKVREIPVVPRLEFIDISSSDFKDIESLTNSIQLQALVANNMKLASFNFSKFTFLPSFKLLETDIKEVTFTSFDKDSSLSLIWVPNCTKVTGIPDYKFKSVNLPGNQLEGDKFTEKHISGTWHTSHRLLFGPWPPIPNDILPQELPKSCFGVIDNISRSSSYISGCIFGLAIGDWLSWNFERYDKLYLNFILEESVNPTWSHIRMTRRNGTSPCGTFSEQTALALLFIRSICETEGELDIKNLAKHIKRWSLEGISEYKEGRGISTSPSFNSVISNNNFYEDPISCSKDYWEKTGRTAGGNVCVSKTAPCGCFFFWDDERVVKQASDFCRITSYDPRCAFSSSLVSLFIARIIRYKIGLSYEFSIDQTIEDCYKFFPELTAPQIHELRRFTNARDLSDLNLESYQQTAMLSLGICIIALRKNMTYKEGIEFTIRIGGDTNGNCSVVSACLGAMWGIDSIPDELFENMFYGGMLFREIEKLLSLMGIRQR
ncbi:Leucine Rich Repeat family protein [Trichomonas vaginalis G3]|uniref:ADP-ribosylhydrolase ARH3 n=1 Tax=Trichomonas vaginalis (strain ATCC PRA-98 / G3) TaxID=412133 RepID=A2FJ71_TRIV3|nr:uncharacterized protein TVAGG3_0440700 [Trichomonas vaginalis G3]EAX95032.1 Leucine Rich Repeat family protein [Trichomonas vaginalis G3]KAI5537434.1 ADP-ribosylglycohydrolase family [Trichomonas vaginalis G3]|eukprot:XP_001307962.1 hypothetical protein [Trichomonas vaginalis G3]